MNVNQRPSWFLVLTATVFLGLSAFFNSELSYFSEAKPNIKPAMSHAPLGGLEPLVADLMWMRLIQFMGSSQDMSDAQRIQETHRQFDRITRLDPKFYLVYRFGTLTLSVQEPEKALDLIDRGLRYMSPEEYDWRFPFYGAFICYQYLEGPGRFDRGLRYLHHLRNNDDAPSFVQRLRPMMLEKQDELDEALNVWMKLYRSSESQMDKRVVKNHIERVAKEIITGDFPSPLQDQARSALDELGVDIEDVKGDEPGDE
ncbi:MAG: hypothetical protein ACOCR1_05315 [Planctomycetota bacterium]